MPKIVAIGGGHGLANLVRGLKLYFPNDNITALVSIFDSGFSSGRLMDLYKILPPGDFTRVMLALSDLEHLIPVFDVRFPERNIGARTIEELTIDAISSLPSYSPEQTLDEIRSLGSINKIIGRSVYIPGAREIDDNVQHSLRNLYYLAFSRYSHSDSEAFKHMNEVFLKKNRRVYPVSLEHVNLLGGTYGGKLLKNEGEISALAGKPNEEMLYILSEKRIRAYSRAVESIMDADYVIISPGSLMTSILPNFCVADINEAVNKTKAKIYMVANLTTVAGDGASEHIDYDRREIVFDRYVLNHLIDIVCRLTDRAPDVVIHADPRGYDERVLASLKEHHARVIEQHEGTMPGWPNDSPPYIPENFGILYIPFIPEKTKIVRAPRGILDNTGGLIHDSIKTGNLIYSLIQHDSLI